MFHQQLREPTLCSELNFKYAGADIYILFAPQFILDHNSTSPSPCESLLISEGFKVGLYLRQKM